MTDATWTRTGPKQWDVRFDTEADRAAFREWFERVDAMRNSRPRYTSEEPRPMTDAEMTAMRLRWRNV